MLEALTEIVAPAVADIFAVRAGVGATPAGADLDVAATIIAFAAVVWIRIGIDALAIA